MVLASVVFPIIRLAELITLGTGQFDFNGDSDYDHSGRLH